MEHLKDEYGMTVEELVSAGGVMLALKVVTVMFIFFR